MPSGNTLAESVRTRVTRANHYQYQVYCNYPRFQKAQPEIQKIRMSCWVCWMDSVQLRSFATSQRSVFLVTIESKLPLSREYVRPTLGCLPAMPPTASHCCTLVSTLKFLPIYCCSIPFLLHRQGNSRVQCRLERDQGEHAATQVDWHYYDKVN